ncbi:MAG: hypothetical protein EBR82_78090 [Caulobacteraceae bacterium]|nr:hypothetical protein [Caulobacteraceae bacterium]
MPSKIEKPDSKQLPPKACKFCCFSAGGGKARECRYNPPRSTGFPRVRHDDWCSKYEANDHLIDAEILRKAAEAQKKLEIEKALNPK